MSSVQDTHGSNRAAGHSIGRRSRRRSTRPAARGQVALGWVALAAVLAVALRNGGEPPVAWTLLCLAVLALFAVQVAVDFRDGLSAPARAALWIAVPVVGVLAWLQVQSMAGLPPGLAHPFWQIAPDGAQPTISAAPDAGWQVVMRLACYGMVFWIFLRAAGAAREGGFAFIQGIALFATALTIYGFVSASTGYNLLLDIEERGGAVRASFLNRNAFATFAVLGVLANVTAYVRSVAGTGGAGAGYALRDFLEAFFSGGWLFAFGALTSLVGLFLTGSRAGVGAGVLGIVVLAWALRHRRGADLGMAVWAIPAGLVAFVALFMASDLLSSIDTADDTSRAAVYAQVLAGTLDRPLLGHGAGAFHEAFRPYVPPDLARHEWTLAHSTYLENAFEFGIPAAAVFYLALGLIGWRLLRGVLTRKRHQPIPAFALACFTAAGFHAGFDFSLQYPANAALLAAILGIGWGQSFPTRHPAGPS